jgi:hypothetical protein
MTLPVEKKRRFVFNVSLLPGSGHRPRDKKPLPIDAKRRLLGYPAPPLSSLLLVSAPRPAAERRGSPSFYTGVNGIEAIFRANCRNLAPLAP